MTDNPDSQKARKPDDRTAGKPENPHSPRILAPYKATPQIVVENMLRLAKLRKDDILFDLGCGDGRILITAAKKYGARCVGVDIDPKCVDKSLMNVKKAGVEDLVEIYHQDAMTVDLSSASVVALYLLPHGNEEIRYRLWEQLKIGARVVSHDYWMEDWPPLRVEVVREHIDLEHLIYLWQIEQKHKEELATEFHRITQKRIEGK